jgi:adenine deaminase
MFPYNKNNRQLIEAALGNTPADLVIRNGILVDVYTGRLTPNRSVAVAGRWIAYVGPDAEYAIGEKTQVIEADGRIISPGFIDGHTHITSFFDVSDFLEYAIPGGTTTYITEADSYGFAMGSAGFKTFLEQVKHKPVKFFCTVPPMVSTSPASAAIAITQEQIRELLKLEQVIGLGESYWQNTVYAKNDRVLDLMQETISAGKSVQGHAAGAADKKLAAYASAGVVSCHESVSPEDILNRLEMGFWTILRQGYIREDLASIKSLIGKIDFRRCILCTDGTDSEYLVRHGYFNDVIQKAIELGIPPVEAIRMVTLNPAELFHIDHLVGGISPGRYADILILPAPDKIRPDIVISNGKIISDKNGIKVDLKRTPYPDEIYNTIKIPFLIPDDLSVPVSKCSVQGIVRTLDIQSNGLVVKEGSSKIFIANGQVLTDPENNLLKVIFIEKTSGKGELFTGFIRGWGMKRGAVASSQVWDASGIIAVGSNDADIALAVNRVIEHQGATILALDGKIEIDIPFPVGGYVSEIRVEEIASGMSAFQKKTEELGAKLRSAHLTLVVLTSAAIPFMRITEKGYFRFRENDYVGI